ncbi:MAG TPA: hypothetical protein VIM51_11195 [Desulfosporosinus sp.]
MLIEQTLEMRGMPHRDLEEYFLSIGGKQAELGTYVFSNWKVELKEEQCLTMGSLHIPATFVTFRVEEEDWPRIVDAFHLRFLSAGG